MGKIKNHGIPESAKDMMKHFGKDAFRLNAYEKKFIQDFGFDTEYMFMARREDREYQRGWCSHCRKWQVLSNYSPERLGHKEEVRCPSCGTVGTVQHAWRMSGELYDEALVYLYRPSVLDPAVVTVRAVVVQRFWGKLKSLEPLAGLVKNIPKPGIFVDSFYVFEPGVGGRMLKPVNNSRIYWAHIWAEGTHSKRPIYEFAKKPFRRDTVYLNNSFGWGQRHWVTVSEDTNGAFKAAENSPLRYGMEEFESYSDDHFLQFWHWSARYPAVEKLVKVGLADMIGAKMNGDKYASSGNVINWKGKTLSSILRGRLTKEDKLFMMDHGQFISMNTFAVWQLFKGRKSLKEAADLAGNSTWNLFTSRWRKINKFVDVIRAWNYIRKKKDRSPDLYADYLGECEKLGYDMTDKAVLFPRDLRTAHAHTMAQIKYQQNQELETDYEKKRRPIMKRKYEWAAMGMVVIVPEHVSDLIAEGERQHNCVGGYMERVANGQTDVVFIRKDKEPEQSYITMEIHNGRIIQARTKNNGPLDKLGEKFVEAFRAEKLEKKRKARKSA